MKRFGQIIGIKRLRVESYTRYEGDMAKMAADETTQEWWALCGLMQNPLEDRAEGEWWKTIEEVFHTA